MGDGRKRSASSKACQMAFATAKLTSMPTRSISVNGPIG